MIDGINQLPAPLLLPKGHSLGQDSSPQQQWSTSSSCVTISDHVQRLHWSGNGAISWVSE